MKDIFISYSSKDIESAIVIRDVLEKNGISCWMAPRDIPFGSNYAKEIPIAIKASKLFLLVFSQNAQDSNFVPKELDIAVTNGKIIFPVMLEECPMTEEFNFLLTGSQRSVLFQKKTETLEDLVHSVGCLLQRDTAPFVPKRSVSAKFRTMSKGTKILLGVFAYLLIVGIIYGICAFVEWLDMDERRYAHQRAEQIICDYATTFLLDTGFVRTTCDAAIQDACEQLEQCSQEYAVIEDFSVRKYRDTLYNNVFISPTLITDLYAEYLYSSDFEPEFAISIHNQTAGYFEEGKNCLDDIEIILRLDETFNADQKIYLLGFFQEYIDLSAKCLELQTNQLLLPLSDMGKMDAVFSEVEESVGHPPLTKDTWSTDADYLAQQYEAVLEQLNQHLELLNKEDALREYVLEQCPAA